MPTILIGIRTMNPAGVSIGGSVLADMVVGTTHGTLMVGVAIMADSHIMADIMDQDTGVVDMPIPAVITMADKIIPALVAQIVSDTVEPGDWLHQL